MDKHLWRVSVTVLVDADRATADNIGGALKAFARNNYSSLIVGVEDKTRDLVIHDFVDLRK